MAVNRYPESPPPRLLNASKAWSCVLVNQLAFPGLGTVWAGRRGGRVQVTLMLAGFFLTVGFMCGIIFHMLSSVLDFSGHSAEPSWTRYRPYFWIGEIGLGLCAVAWVWALMSSIGILRDRRRADLP